MPKLWMSGVGTLCAIAHYRASMFYNDLLYKCMFSVTGGAQRTGGGGGFATEKIRIMRSFTSSDHSTPFFFSVCACFP